MNITSATPLMSLPTALLDGVSAEVVRPVRGLNVPSPSDSNPSSQAGIASNEVLAEMVEEANAKLRNGSQVEFTVHDGSNRVIVRLVDPESMEVIREFPNTKLLDILSKLQELSGINVDTVT
jgi:flagellar protein FlaG